MSTILSHTVCLSANLECMSEMCCTRLDGNTKRKNDAKNRHLRTIAQLCRAISLQLRQYRQSGNISPTRPRNMVHFCLLAAEIRWQV